MHTVPNVNTIADTSCYMNSLTAMATWLNNYGSCIDTSEHTLSGSYGITKNLCLHNVYMHALRE